MAVDLSVFQRLKGKAAFDREAEEFALRKQQALQQAQGQDPAPLKLANEYQARIDAGDIDGANLIMQFAKTQDRGLAVDSNGNFAPLPNYADAVGSIAGAKAMYEQNAQNQSDLGYKPMIARDVAQQQANVEMATKPKITASTSAMDEKAKNYTDFLNNYSKQENASKLILDSIANLRDKNGNLREDVRSVVGAKNIFKGAVPFTTDLETGLPSTVSGSPAANGVAKIEQIRNQAFLEAYESLRGSGALTNIEGEKGTKAKARISAAQTEDEFKAGVKDLEDVIIAATNRNATKKAEAQSYLDGLVNQSQNANFNDIPRLSVNDLNDPMAASQTAIIQRQEQVGVNPNQRNELKPLPKAQEAEAIFNAKKAIQKGKDPAAVRKRLLDNGIDPAKAGL